MPDESRSTLARVRDDCNGRPAYGTRHLTQPPRWNLEYAVTTEPRCARPQLTTHSGKRSCSSSKRLGDCRNEALVYLAEKPQGDVPLFWSNGPEALDGPEL